MEVIYVVMLLPAIIGWLTPAQCPITIIPENNQVEMLEDVNVSNYIQYVNCRDLPELKIK